VSSTSSSTGVAGDTGGSSYSSAPQQPPVLSGTSVQWAPGVGVVPAVRQDAAAAATLGVAVRSGSSGDLSSSGAGSGHVAAPAPVAADPVPAAAGTVEDPREPEAAVADATAAEQSSVAGPSVAADSAAGTERASGQQGSPQAGLVKGLWDTALMSYLQRDTALLEGITGGTHRPRSHRK
jgi:hypothetical protein